MKRFLLVIPVMLFILLNSCDDPNTVSPAEATAVVQTQIAAAWTPTTNPASMYAYQISQIIILMNGAIEVKETATSLNVLEHTIAASYQVYDVNFPLENDGSTTFQIEIHCECAENGQCCNYEQTFMEAIRAMDTHKDSIINLVPPPARYLKVSCYDHGNRQAVVSVPWEDVKRFLRNEISGFELGGRITLE